MFLSGVAATNNYMQIYSYLQQFFFQISSFVKLWGWVR